MRRLNRGRGRPERGASAILVALILMVLCGFAAIAVDAGALWWDRKQLQNGADAGALAIAQVAAKVDCPGEATEVADAEDFAEWNKDANAKVESVDCSTEKREVRVELNSTRGLWFANVLGLGDAEVRAAATAKWGAPLRASVLPITVATCGFDELGPDPFGKSVDIVFKDSHNMGVLPLLPDKKTVDCAKIVKDGSRDYSGGFGWLAQSETACIADIEPSTMAAPGKPGVGNAACFEALVDRLKESGEVEVELPVFDQVPEHKLYRISGFITLNLTAVCFKYEYPSTKKWCSDTNLAEGRPQNSLFIRGKFVKRTTLSTSGGGGPTPYGTKVVWLSD